MQSIQLFLTHDDVTAARVIGKHNMLHSLSTIALYKYLRINYNVLNFNHNMMLDRFGIVLKPMDKFNGNLLLDSNDNKDHRYVLAKVFNGDTVRLCGWQYGYNVKLPHYEYNTGHTKDRLWLMAENKLRDISELLFIIKNKF